jgi:hypothetical protein
MEPSVEQAPCWRLQNAETARPSGGNSSVRPGGTECNVRASLTAVVFSIRKWSIEVHDCVMDDSMSVSLVVVLMDRAINFVIFQMADVIVLDRTLRARVFDEQNWKSRTPVWLQFRLGKARATPKATS